MNPEKKSYHRVFHQLAVLAWNGLDLECSIILPSCSTISAETENPICLSRKGTECKTSKIKVNQTKVHELVEQPVDTQKGMSYAGFPNRHDHTTYDNE